MYPKGPDRGLLFPVPRSPFPVPFLYPPQNYGALSPFHSGCIVVAMMCIVREQPHHPVVAATCSRSAQNGAARCCWHQP
jgi:hypothetical protein